MTILERMIKNIIGCGVTEFIIVTGFLADDIKAFVRLKFPNLNVSYIHNPVYDSTNNIYSLWLARAAVAQSDLLLLDSDIIFDRRILEILLNSQHENCLALRSSGEIGAEEMKITTNTQGQVVEIAKTILPDLAAGESVGIEKFSRQFVGQLYRVLEILVVEQQQVNKFYELAFQKVIDGGQKLYACDVGTLRCIEIDTPDDMKTADILAIELD